MFGVVFLVALAVRSITFLNVVTPFGVQFPFIGDLYYHMRRIWYTTVDFPNTISFDPYVSFPNGAEIVWPPLFDWSIAALARLLVGPESQSAVERVVIWVPPLVGAATAVLAAAIAVRSSRSAKLASGWWAGLLFAVLPMSFTYSQLGQLDHHGAVALATTAMLAIGMATVARWRTRLLAAGAALGASMGAVLLLWPGALLHVGVVQAALGLWWLAAADRGSAVGRGLCLAVCHAVAAAVVAPFALGRTWEQYGAWSPLVLSDFQPVYFGLVAAGSAAAAGLFARTPAGASPGRRVGTVVLLGGALVAVALVAVPALRESLFYASGWFAREEDFQTHVRELQSLLQAKGGGFDPGFAIRNLGFVFLFFPLVLGRLAWSAWERRSAPLGLLAAWTTVFLALALLQLRFGNTFSVAYAIACGVVVAEVAGALRRGRPRSRPLRWAATGAAVLIGLMTLDSFVGAYKPFAVRAEMAARNPAYRRAGLLAPKHLLFDVAARWMAAETPPTRGYLDVSQEPEYGVLCNWGLGHLVRYRSERPTVQDNFGVYGGRETYEAAWRYYLTSDEAEAAGLLERLGVRYVVSDFQGPGASRPASWNSMLRLLNGTYGSETRLPDGRTLPALSRHRLVFHAHTDRRSDRGGPLAAERPHYSLGVWELVEGARVDGTATPGVRVEATLELATNVGRRHVYRTSAVADAEGRYTLVLPYPTSDRFSPAVRAADHYLVSAGESTQRVSVSEEAVRQGLALTGPDF